MPAGVLVAGVVLVEQKVEAREPGVDVGGGEVEPVVVIPERGELLERIVAGREVPVVMVPELAGVDPVHRVAVALRGRVGVVEMAGGRGEPEADLGVPHRRQVVVAPHEDRRAVVGRVGGPRRARRESPRLEAPGPAPSRVGRVRMVLPEEFPLVDLVEFLGQEFLVALMGARVRRRVEPGDRQHHRRHEQLAHPRPRRRARRLVVDLPRPVVRRAEEPHQLPVLRQRLPGAEEARASGQQTELQNVPSRRHRIPPARELLHGTSFNLWAIAVGATIGRGRGLCKD